MYVLTAQKRPHLGQYAKFAERSKMMAERPDFVQDEYLEYLDNLRESGETNMYGATPFLQDEFPELDKRTAREVLQYWMKTFGQDER